MLRRDARHLPLLHNYGSSFERREHGACSSRTSRRSSRRPTTKRLGSASPTTACRSSAPTTTGSHVKQRFEGMGTRVDPCRAARSGRAARAGPVPLGVQEGRISLNRFVELISTNPAKIMGLYRARASCRRAPTPTSRSSTRTGAGRCAPRSTYMGARLQRWEGWELTGKVVTTIQRGRCWSRTSSGSARSGGRYLSGTCCRRSSRGARTSRDLESARATALA